MIFYEIVMGGTSIKDYFYNSETAQLARTPAIPKTGVLKAAKLFKSIFFLANLPPPI